MTNEQTNIIEYPSEIHRILKIGGSAQAEASQTFVLPQAEASTHEKHAEPEADIHGRAGYIEEPQAKRKTWKNFIIYPIVFIGAFMFFYILFNFSALFAQFQSWFTKPQEEVVLGQDLAPYYTWIQGYYFTVNDSKLLDPHNDIDKDGLSNHDEFAMKTNPTIADSDTDGFSDGIEFINNMNLWGDGAMPQQQRKLAENLDSILINNRIGYNISQNAPVGGVVSGKNTITYDLSRPGKLSVPRLNLQVPLQWPQDPVEFDAALTKGVIHYPGTAMPGEEGVFYVSGHSSDYLWKRNPFGNVFSTLNRLQAGDDIFIELYGPDGKVYHYRYTVVSQRVYAADDQTQFTDNSGKKLNLSTCWPIGTQKDRLVVTAVEKSL